MISLFIIMHHARHSQKFSPKLGFSLLELLISLAILGVIVGLSYEPLMQFYQQQKQESAAQTLMHELKNQRQQALAAQQARTLNFTYGSDILTLKQINNGITSILFEQKGIKSFSMKSDQTNGLQALNINQFGQWSYGNNQPIQTHVLLNYGQFGVKIFNDHKISLCRVNNAQTAYPVC